MAEKHKYIAKVGINFDGLKGKPRVEPGEPIPAGVPQATINDLLADGVIEIHEEEVKETK